LNNPVVQNAYSVIDGALMMLVFLLGAIIALKFIDRDRR